MSSPLGNRWFKIFSEYLPKGNIRLSENPKAVNVGCGSRVVWNFAGFCFFSISRGLGLPRYVGVDIKPEKLSFEKPALNKIGGADLIAADARKLSRYIKEQFDLAIIEHPDFTISPDAPKNWQKVLEEIYKLLTETGGLILTTFWLQDHFPAQVALKRMDFTIFHSGTNKYPGKQFDTSSEGEPLLLDKYIILAAK